MGYCSVLDVENTGRPGGMRAPAGCELKNPAGNHPAGRFSVRQSVCAPNRVLLPVIADRTTRRGGQFTPQAAAGRVTGRTLTGRLERLTFRLAGPHPSSGLSRLDQWIAGFVAAGVPAGRSGAIKARHLNGLRGRRPLRGQPYPSVERRQSTRSARCIGGFHALTYLDRAAD